MITERDEAERYLRNRFEQSLTAQLDRYLQARVHEVIPGHFFSKASAECRDLFVFAHYYGCISLAQAVSERLSMFLAGVNQHRKVNDYRTRVRRLSEAGAISRASLDSFLAVWGTDRNDYHHLNSTVETDYARLHERAWGCVEALYVIESDVFAFDINDGRIVPRHPKYWPQIETGLTDVFLRFV